MPRAAHGPPAPVVPSHFVCPLTHDMMRDPVVASDGYTYERSAVEGWMTNNSHSPMTGAKLEDTKLVPIIPLKNAIQEWCNQQAAAVPPPPSKLGPHQGGPAAHALSNGLGAVMGHRRY